MELWEIVQRMQYGDFELGDRFDSEAGEVYIDANGALKWLDTDELVEISLGWGLRFHSDEYNF